MFLVLRKSSIRRTLALAILLMLIGYAIANPFTASASNREIAYLYPYVNNNPVEATGLFWAEANPEMGAYSLAIWNTLLSNKLVVIGIPENQGYMMGTSLDSLGDKLGKYIVYRMKNRLAPTPPPEKAVKAPAPPKDQFVYKRTVGDVTEEIKVDIGEHFKDNNSFKKFMDTVSKNLTNDSLIKDTNKKAPAPAPVGKKLTLVPEDSPTSPTPEAAKAVGNTLMISGALIMLMKLLPLLAL